MNGESYKRNCEKCGACCSYEVPVTLWDIQNLADHYHITAEEAFNKFVNQEESSSSGLWTLSTDHSDTCRFLDAQNRCTIYEARPQSCCFFKCFKISEINDQQEDHIHMVHWIHSLSLGLTKQYITRNGSDWNQSHFETSIKAIKQLFNVWLGAKVHESSKPENKIETIAMSLPQCTNQGQTKREIPITIDDIDHMANVLHVEVSEIFDKYLDMVPSRNEGVFQLKRGESCVCLSMSGCALGHEKPSYCRQYAYWNTRNLLDVTDQVNSEMSDIDVQYRREVAMDITREYIESFGMAYAKAGFERAMQSINRRYQDIGSYEAYCSRIAPCRFTENLRPPAC